MVLEGVDNQSEATRATTPMSEIRRHKGILFDKFCRAYPDWEWSERRKRNRLMYDEQGRCWVPMIEPESGLPYGYDEPGFTPTVEEALAEISRKAMEEVRAGRYYTLDDLDAEDGIAK